MQFLAQQRRRDAAYYDVLGAIDSTPVVIDGVDCRLPQEREESADVHPVPLLLPNLRYAALDELHVVAPELVVGRYLHQAQRRVFVSVCWFN